MALLSVIVPLYNQEKHIYQCISSIQNQTLEDIEIIIVDDGSTDGSRRICETLAADDRRITVLHQENRGSMWARFSGLDYCTTKYVTFVDADDFITSNAYDDATKYMENDFDQVFYEISRYYDNARVKRDYHILEPGIYDRTRIVNDIYPKLIWDFNRNTPGVECSLCVRILKRNLLIEEYKRVRGKSFYYGDDIAITFPSMQKIEKLAVISKSYYMHRQRDNNRAPEYISADGYFDEIANLYAYLREAMKEDGTYDFNRQIDYMYIHSVGLKKWSYGDYEYHRDFLFPFHKVQVGKKIVLYGAGLVGSMYHKQLMKLDYCEELLWIDMNADIINNPLVKPVIELDRDEVHSFDSVVVAIENQRVANDVREYLISKGYSPEKIII